MEAFVRPQNRKRFLEKRDYRSRIRRSAQGAQESPTWVAGAV
jgi:hypothetical protein